MKRALSLTLVLLLLVSALVGCGSHEQLLESCPIYREIFLSQTGGEIA